MKKYRQIICLILCVMIVSLCGCSYLDSAVETVKGNREWKEKLKNNDEFRTSKNIENSIPVATGEMLFESGNVLIDYGNSHEGYCMIKYIGGSDKKIKILTMSPNDIVYTYNCNKGGEFNTIPFTQGDGTYVVNVLEQLQGNEYITIAAKTLEVQIEDEMSPFLHANQYVNFTAETLEVADAQKLYSETETDIEFVEMVYDYTQAHIKYDEEKANQILEGKLTGYIPNLDEIYKTGKGICFDYAVMMVAMLRMQGIPTKLNIGYVGDVYHAWISVFTEEEGWIDNIVEFNGTDWIYMDPTYADTTSNKSFKSYVGEGIGYVEKYIY